MPREKTKVLDKRQLQQKVDRIAYQVYEDNYKEKQVYIAGVADNGYRLAEKIAKTLTSVSPLKVKLIEVVVDRENPIEGDVGINLEDKELRNSIVVLVDDVLNSGKTLMYGTRRFLRLPLKKLRTVVLVNRDHRRFPINADFVGMSLATTMQEHVHVDLEKGKEAVYLV